MHTTAWDRDLLREALEEIMDRAGLSQAAVGKLAGRDRTIANRWLSGVHKPAYDAATRFASAIAHQYPELSGLAQKFLTSAGYSPASVADVQAPAATNDPRSGHKEAVEELREIAREQDKTIGDLLVERGLATPDELTLSDAKVHDPIVEEILASDLSEETKNSILLDYAERRRYHFRKAGLTENVESHKK